MRMRRKPQLENSIMQMYDSTLSTTSPLAESPNSGRRYSNSEGFRRHLSRKAVS